VLRLDIRRCLACKHRDRSNAILVHQVDNAVNELQQQLHLDTTGDKGRKEANRADRSASQDDQFRVPNPLAHRL
jgi:hypothetical protein